MKLVSIDVDIVYVDKYVRGMSESQEPKLGGFPSKSERTKSSEFLL